MRRTIKLLALTAVFAVFAVPALAQSRECNDEFKSATYSKWYDNRKEHQDVAYQAAKEYLATCPDDPSPYTAAIKKFATDYERETAKVTNKKQFEEAFQKKNYAEQIRIGKEILASEPDNTPVYIIMGVAGLGDPNLLNESVQYAKKSIELIEAGKPFAPYAARDQALAALNYVIARASLKRAPADAIPYLLKAARLESDLKKNPQLYLDLAAAYNDGPRAKLTAEYPTKVGPENTETPESKLVLLNLNQIIDRQIDALARATALSSNPADKKAIMDELTATYKDRNKTETGLPELVATVLSKPLPDVPTPITSLPTTPTVPANPGSQSGTSTGTTTTAGTKAGNTGTGNGTGTSTGSQAGRGAGSAKPTASPTPGKKPRANHRRG
jgi:hypothetical protein